MRITTSIAFYHSISSLILHVSPFIISFYLLICILSSLGLANWVTVAGQVFSYIAMLKTQGPQEWIYEEIRQIAEVDFEFLDEEDEADLVDRLSVEMGPYNKRDRADLLTAPVSYE